MPSSFMGFEPGRATFGTIGWEATNDLAAAYSLLDADFFIEPLSFQKLIIESILSMLF